jgi:acyl carrier protein
VTTRPPIDQIISDFITDELLRKPGETTLDPDENLFSGGLIDSVGIMRLITHLEKSLGVKIPPGDLVPKNFRTIAVMTAYLEGLNGGA